MGKARENLEQYIKRWLEAYHTDIIPDIDTKTLDSIMVTRISGKVGRHILNCILRDIPEIFDDKDGE